MGRLPYPLSNLTYLWVLVIFSASFGMRQVLRTFVKQLGIDLVPLVIWGLFILMAYVLIRTAIQRRMNIFLFVVIFLCGVLYALTFSIVEERAHLVKFGILGWLVARDLWPFYQESAIFRATIFAFVISALDESIQYFLPYRVCDPRDVVFGAIGGLWGALFFCSLTSQRLAALLKIKEASDEPSKK